MSVAIRGIARRRSKLVDKLKRLDGEVAQTIRTRECLTDCYNYIMIKRMIRDVLALAKTRREISTSASYILPGALWIVKQLVSRRMSIHVAAAYVGKVRRLARRLFKTLVYEHDLTLLVPSNVSICDVRVYLWVDKVGYDRVGRPLYILTMYFSFPFDIMEVDRRSEYEPISFLFVDEGGVFRPAKAFARVHYNIYAYNVSSPAKILFMRYGHTPKLLDVKATCIDCSRRIADAIWFHLGEYITKLLGVTELHVKDDPRGIRVYVWYKLPKTRNNPFRAPIHPYFIDLRIYEDI